MDPAAGLGGSSNSLAHCRGFSRPLGRVKPRLFILTRRCQNGARKKVPKKLYLSCSQLPAPLSSWDLACGRFPSISPGVFFADALRAAATPAHWALSPRCCFVAKAVLLLEHLICLQGSVSGCSPMLCRWGNAIGGCFWRPPCKRRPTSGKLALLVFDAGGGMGWQIWHVGPLCSCMCCSMACSLMCC